jgi:hypothetical protein
LKNKQVMGSRIPVLAPALIHLCAEARPGMLSPKTEGNSMGNEFSRRTLLKFASAVIPIGAVERTNWLSGPEVPSGGGRMLVSDSFPAQPPELVREMVTVAHFDLKRVKELAAAHPALAKAAWDWGFGDWETALGAASHMGNRAMAEFLIEQGAHPTIFSAAMLGNLEAVKAMIGSAPGLQRIRGPHSISLLAHARMGGEAAKPVLEFLHGFDDADSEAPIPLSAEETAALVGTYGFGVGVTQQVEVNADLKVYVGSKMYTHAPQLNWTRKGTMTRPLFHLGRGDFYPAGAPAVRVRFAQVAEGMEMRVTDGEVEMTALRKNQAQG